MFTKRGLSFPVIILSGDHVWSYVQDEREYSKVGNVH